MATMRTLTLVALVSNLWMHCLTSAMESPAAAGSTDSSKTPDTGSTDSKASAVDDDEMSLIQAKVQLRTQRNLGPVTTCMFGCLDYLSSIYLMTLMDAQATHMHEDPHPLTNWFSISQPIPLKSDKVLFATVDTRGQELHRLKGPPGWDWAVHNVGAGKPWHGFVTKVKLMQDWVATLSDDQYVVFVDGLDVMYGGCDLREMLERFEVLSRMTNASVIFGAEYNCMEAPTAGCANYPGHGRDESLDAFHLKAEDLDSWRSSAPNWGGGRMALKFLNSGFYMGQVKNLKQLYAELMALSSQRSSDQGWAAQVLQNRPDLLALDYGTMLVSTLFGIRLDKDGQQLFSFQDTEKQWLNHVTGKSVCFFHDNGPKLAV